MPTPALTDEEIARAVAAVRTHRHDLNAAAAALNLNAKKLRHRLLVAERRGMYAKAEGAAPAAAASAVARELHLPTPPPAAAAEPIDDLVARRKRAMARAQAHDAWQQLIPVAVPDARPIGLLLVGDPHVDDDGCDIAQLEHDLTTVGKTPGFFAGHIGDLTNNWVGRLARLYAHQATTAAEAVRLTEWMLGLCPTLFLVGGNHDVWNAGMDVLTFIARQGTVAHTQAHGARLALNWGDGAQMRIHARHDFPGRSQFSSTHGMKRELLWGHRDHILVAGHTHVDEARCEPSLEGDAHWLFRVSGYKVLDDYANANRFRPQRLAPSVAVVLEPHRKTPADRVKPFWDVAGAADYLTWRRRAKA